MKNALILAAMILAGCTSSTGALRSGPDTLTVKTTASPGAGGAITAKKNAYVEATQECTRQNRALQTISENSTEPTWADGMHSVNLVFKCV